MHLPLVLGPRFDPRSRRGKFRCPNTLSLVSFVGMTLDKCIVLRIRTLTGCHLCSERHPLCRLKSPAVISIWLLVGFHPATRSVQSTPVDNTQRRVWQYIEKERKMVQVQRRAVWFVKGKSPFVWKGPHKTTVF